MFPVTERESITGPVDNTKLVVLEEHSLHSDLLLHPENKK